ncbi:GGDEF domain-containing protein [Agarivorans sp. TSD2052]|uniref:GGDEF domain-containing protein n=1 Tax=Agarivorans sp. TSD2052 TaxID=2937286 RepID=UPI0020103DBB|nr:GGDEF domain-containing protein [Agarivorans sp. TSD2052]UPW19050.1 GGDEF domain-containing protein [Agarivorans sp. TSD2052]
MTSVTVVSAVVLTLIRYFHGKQAALDCWIAACYAQVFGLLCLLLFEQATATTLLIQNGLFVGSFLLILAGHHHYLKLSFNRSVFGAMLALYCMVMFYYIMLEPSVKYRAVVFSVSIALCCLYSAYLYFRYWRQQRTHAIWLVISLYLFFASCLVIRAHITLQGTPEHQGLLLGVPALLSLALFIGSALQTYVFFFLLHWRQIIQLEQLANYDITGAMRRNYFIQQLTKLTTRAKFSGKEVTVIFIDLDRFKSINDLYGHDSGDKALMHFSHIALSNLRVGDLFGRFGGEEFVIALNEANVEQAYMLANRIRIQLNQQGLPTPKGQLFMSASFGVASSIDKPDISDLIKYADQAMYQAKNQGGNKVCQHRLSEAPASG